MELNVSYIDITPASAKKYLEAASLEAKKDNGFKNRRFVKTNYQKMCSAIKTGAYHGFLGCVVFDESGRLIDGQHRLAAIRDCDKTVKQIVVQGAATDVYKYIDNLGKPKGNSEVLKISGIKNAPTVTAGFNIFYAVKNKNKLRLGGSSPLIANDILDLYSTYGPDKVQKIAALSLRMYSDWKVKQSASMAAMLLIQDGEDDLSVLQTFVEGVCKSSDLYEDDPRVLLQKRSNSARAKGSDPKSANEDFLFFVKTWNAFISGAQPKRSFNVDKNQVVPTILKSSDLAARP